MTSTTSRRGLIAGIFSYTCWGFFPLYWKPLHRVPALEILSHRVAWSLVFVVGVLLWQRRTAWIPAALRDWKLVARFALSAAVLSLNWFLYIWAVNAGHVVETSLGYFINPLVNVLLGRVVLGERLRRGQQLAVGLAALGVTWLTVSFGALPWIALTLALSFGSYGLMRKIAPLGSLEGLSLETLLLGVPAIGFLLWQEHLGVGHFGHDDALTNGMLAGAGIVTAVPLLAFAQAARALPLATVGLLQFIAPTIQFLIGVLVYAEPLDSSRLVGFLFIWVAVATFAVEGQVQSRRARKLLPVASS